MPTTNGREQVFNDGIKNNDSRPADISANYLVTQNADGTFGKIESENIQSRGWVVNSQLFNTDDPSVVTTGSAFDYSENGLVVSGGNGTFNNHSNLTNYTLLEDHQIELGEFTNTVEGSGIGVGIDCAFSEVAICKVDLTAGANRGKIYISRNKSTFDIVSSNALSFSNTDLLKIVLRRSKYSVYVYFKNITTGAQIVASFDITATALLAGAGYNVNRTGTPAIWAFGGTQTFTKTGGIVYKSYSEKSPKLAIIGTSIEVGYAPGIIENRWSNFNGEAKFSTVLMASSSATTADVINALPELLKVKPEYASFSIGVNDSATDYATVTANFRTINNFCIANNIKTIWVLISPKTNPTQNTNITALNSFITGTLSNEGVTKIIDFNTLLTAGGVLNPNYSVDGVHLNPAANIAMAKYYIANTKDLFLYDDQRSIYRVGVSNTTTTSALITTTLQGHFTPAGINKFLTGNNGYLNDSGVFTRYNTSYGALQEVSSVGSVANTNTKLTGFLNPSGTYIPILSALLSSDGLSVNNGFGVEAPETNVHIRGNTGLKLDWSTDVTSNVVLAPVSAGRWKIDMNAPTANDALFDLNPKPINGTGKAAVRFFRDTNTTGVVRIEIMQGNGSGNANCGISGNGDTFLNALAGNVAIGLSTPTYKLHVGNGSFSAYDTTNGGIQIGAAAGLSKFYTGINGLQINNATNSVNIITVKNDGNVIIPILTANRIVTTDASKNLVSSAVTSTELGYLSGVTSSIQTQLDSKVAYSSAILTTGNQSFTGAKSAVNTGTFGAVNGLNLENAGTADSRVINLLNSNTGIGMYLINSASGIGSYDTNSSSGVLKIFESSTGSTGDLTRWTKNLVTTAKVDQNGEFTAQKYNLNTGTNASVGNAVLVAGTVTVTTTSGTASSIIILSRKTAGGVVGNITYVPNAGGFTINSDSATDTSTISYLIIN